MAGCCDPGAERPKMLKVGGSSIGVFGLDRVISEVAALGPLTDDQLSLDLLTRFRKYNYFPDSASVKYAEALAAEYRKYISTVKKANIERKGTGMEIKVLGPGCKNCKTLEGMVLKILEDMGVKASVEKVENPKKIADLGVLITGVE